MHRFWWGMGIGVLLAIILPLWLIVVCGAGFLSIGAYRAYRELPAAKAKRSVAD